MSCISASHVSRNRRCPNISDASKCMIVLAASYQSRSLRGAPYAGTRDRVGRSIALGPYRTVRGVRTIATISKARSSKAEAEGSHPENITMSVASRTCHAPPPTMPTMCVTPHTHHTRFGIQNPPAVATRELHACFAYLRYARRASYCTTF